MRSADATDCYMNASLLSDPRTAFAQCALHAGGWPHTSRRPHALPKLHRWHATSQDRLFSQLLSIWSDLQPRVMVDLGCSAGLGRFRNVSDIVSWLDFFNHTGSTVVGVDVFEDSALDVHHRLHDVHPYSTLTQVEKVTVHAAMHHTDGVELDVAAVARSGISCCAGVWCGWKLLEKAGVTDHSCRLARQRLNMSSSSLPLPPTKYPGFFPAPRGMRQTLASPEYHKLRYPVPSLRLDTLWRQRLHARRIDFLKIDVDKGWRFLGGLETLISSRAFSVLTIELDGHDDNLWFSRRARGVMKRHGMHNVSQIDQLLWLAHRSGFEPFLKIPCCAKDTRRHAWLEPPASAWYHPLLPRRDGGSHLVESSTRPIGPSTASASTSRARFVVRPAAFVPTGLTSAAMNGTIQDLMLVDATGESGARLVALLSEGGKASCFPTYCCSKHSKRSCATYEPLEPLG